MSNLKKTLHFLNINRPKISAFTILGERCSGTKYLEQIFSELTGLEANYSICWKHFFGFDDEKISQTKDVLYLGIARNPYDWACSFHKTCYHCGYLKSKNNFLQHQIISTNDKSQNIILRDKNFSVSKDLEQAPHFKNLIELRNVKLKYLIQDMPKIVHHYKYICYDDLRRSDLQNYLTEICKEFYIKTTSKKITPFKEPQKYHFNPKDIELLNNNLQWDIENIAGFTKKQ